MKYFSSFKMSFILAASLVIAVNASMVKRAESSILVVSNASAAKEGGRRIADIEFADKKFERCIKDMGREYVRNLYSIFCNNRGITDVGGIEKLTSLQIIHLHYNKLTSINTSELKHLIALYASNNRLTSVDVTNNRKLKRLLLSNNDLVDLNVRNNEKLEILDVSSNHLASLSVGRGFALTQLRVSDNHIRKLQLMRSPDLVTLVADNNEITELNFMNNPAIEYVSVIDNNLETLKVSNRRKLSVLRAIYNPLRAINVTNSNRLKQLSFNQKVSCMGKRCQIATHERPRLSDIDFKDSNLNFCIKESYPNAKYVDQMTELDCSSRGIAQSDGLEQLTALTMLNLRNNMIKEVNTRDMPMLKDLVLLRNDLTRIDVTNNKKLSRLLLGFNRIKHVDVSNNKKLEQLLANNNRIKQLDLGNNQALSALFLLDNPLSKLDLSENNSLLNLQLAPTTECYGEICPTYRVKGEVGINGTINPAEQLITHGHTAQFVITPDNGYSIEQIVPVGCEGNFDGRLFTTSQIAGFCAVYTTFVKTTIAHVDFGDENLRNCIIEQYGDDAQVADVTSVSCNNKGITSTQGLEQFTNITQLTLRANQITEIDVSEMNELTSLSLLNNQLVSLDVSNNQKLQRLTLGNNQLTALNTENNPQLHSLFVNGNPIEQLDFTFNLSLSRLFALDTNLSELDLSSNLLITELKLDNDVICHGSVCGKRNN